MTARPIPARLAALKTTPTPELKATVARPVRQRAAAIQPPLPREPARLPHPGTRLWRAEAGDDPAAGAARRGAGRRRPEEAPHPRRPRPPDHRHAAAARMAGRRAGRHRHRRRLRMAGAALQVAVRHRPRDHRHALERLGLLRAQEPQGADMTKPPEKSKVVRKLRCAVYTRKSSEEGLEQEFNSPPRPARGLRGVHRQPAVRGLGAGPRSV